MAHPLRSELSERERGILEAAQALRFSALAYRSVKHRSRGKEFRTQAMFETKRARYDLMQLVLSDG